MYCHCFTCYVSYCFMCYFMWLLSINSRIITQYMSLCDDDIHDCIVQKCFGGCTGECVCVRACVYVSGVSSFLSLGFLVSAPLLLGARGTVPTLVFRRSLDDASTPPTQGEWTIYTRSSSWQWNLRHPWNKINRLDQWGILASYPGSSPHKRERIPWVRG